MDIIAIIKERLGNKILKINNEVHNRVFLDIEARDIPEAVSVLFKDIGCRLSTASGIDAPSCIEILYHFSFDKTGQMITLKTALKDKKNPRIKSITPIIKGAEWIEREMWELLGIHFENHPNLTRLLLAEDWPQGEYPLRHDENYKQYTISKFQ